MHTTRAFTLVETIIYLALYAIIMGGVVLAAYSIFESGARNQTRAMVQEEGNFLVGKIDWALTGINAISAPAGNTTGQTLTVIKDDSVVGTVSVDLADGVMTLTRSGTTRTLSNTNIMVTGTPFITHTLASTDGINPESITARFTITASTSDGFKYSQDFVTTKYVRK